MTLVACADVGSTYTKVVVVDVADGSLVATAQHPTTVATDVLDGLDHAVAATGTRPTQIRACSSAGGGLRLAVVGHEALVTAAAGRRVALSAGARVVHVAAGRLDSLAELEHQRPDVVLLVGGTDGGDADTLVHNARRLRPLSTPVVVAGNADARSTVVDLLGEKATATENVLPRIGVLNPGPARAAIREVFLRHVIGGKKLSRSPRFADLVRGPTPDIVLTAAELLSGELAIVDVGGATTDVYSVLSPDQQPQVAGSQRGSRTVEGDLGVRWNAPGIVEAARAERLLTSTEDDALSAAAADRAADPTANPADGADRRLATLAATVAMRRHARPEVPAAGGQDGRGRDLTGVRLLIGSGGVLRHTDGVLEELLADHGGGWRLPRRATTAVDQRCVLAAAGLLAADCPAAAATLLRRHLSAA